MKLPDDCFPAYILFHEAWYGDVRRPYAPNETGREVSISAASHGGGAAWEFSLVEKELGGKLCLHLRVFDDAWAAFAQVPELFAALGESGDGTSFEEVVKILDRLGFKDTTARSRES